jgi:hypothetical protein
LKSLVASGEIPLLVSLVGVVLVAAAAAAAVVVLLLLLLLMITILLQSVVTSAFRCRMSRNTQERFL